MNEGMPAMELKFLSLQDQLTRARKGIGMAIQSDKKGNSSGAAAPDGSSVAVPDGDA